MEIIGSGCVGIVFAHHLAINIPEVDFTAAADANYGCFETHRR